MKLRLNYKGWCQRYVTCLCKDCKSYDDHLVEYHDLPKAQERTKAEKSQTKKQFISVVNVVQNIQPEFFEAAYCHKAFGNCVQLRYL